MKATFSRSRPGSKAPRSQRALARAYMRLLARPPHHAGALSARAPVPQRSLQAAVPQLTAISERLQASAPPAAAGLNAARDLLCRPDSSLHRPANTWSLRADAQRVLTLLDSDPSVRD